MQPAPQGVVIVGSPPRGAGRRGRDLATYVGGYDWDEIVAKAREIIASQDWVRVSHVPYGSMGELRKRYPDCAFVAHAVHQRTSHQGRAFEVCDVYVKAGEDGNTAIES